MFLMLWFFFFKQNTAYEVRISDCSSDVCSSDLDQFQGFFDGPVDHLMALPILADYVKEKYGDQPLAGVSPDAGRIKVAERWSARLGGVPLAFIHKTRRTDRPNETVANRGVGEVKGRYCVLTDDIIDTGGTIVKAAEALMEEGAAGVIMAATHPILSGPAVDRLKNSSATEVIVTDTLPPTEEPRFDKLTILQNGKASGRESGCQDV